jgi:NAD(P)-dependent dehydrogenase (short-subunit alcohol dehydrogenase family)
VTTAEATRADDHADRSLRFDDQVVVITGAGKGLGRAYALSLARRGAAVLVNNRRQEGETRGSADDVAAEIRAAGGRAVPNHEEVDCVGAGERIVGAAIEEFGRIDVAIANAGVSRVAAFHRMSLAEIREIIAINLDGAIELLHAALPHLREQKSGRMLVTTSSAALYGDAGFVAYATAKAALIGLVASLAHECTRVGVGVNAILPLAHTPMTHGLFAGDVFPPGSADVLGPEPVADLATWLVSGACDRSGEVWIAGGRVFQRAAVATSPGIVVEGPVTPELLARRAAEIADVAAARTYASGAALLEEMAERTLGLV